MSVAVDGWTPVAPGPIPQVMQSFAPGASSATSSSPGTFGHWALLKSVNRKAQDGEPEDVGDPDAEG